MGSVDDIPDQQVDRIVQNRVFDHFRTTFLTPLAIYSSLGTPKGGQKGVHNTTIFHVLVHVFG